MYNHTMIEMNISSRGKYVRRIKDIQLSKQQRNETLQMAFMSEYKREYKYCTLIHQKCCVSDQQSHKQIRNKQQNNQVYLSISVEVSAGRNGLESLPLSVFRRPSRCRYHTTQCPVFTEVRCDYIRIFPFKYPCICC